MLERRVHTAEMARCAPQTVILLCFIACCALVITYSSRKHLAILSPDFSDFATAPPPAAAIPLEQLQNLESMEARQRELASGLRLPASEAQTQPPAADRAGNDSSRLPLILVYHPLHESRDWWFKMSPDTDFAVCQHKCQVTSDRTKFKDADLVLFESPRKMSVLENGDIQLEYFRSYGLWPVDRGNPHQTRMFYAREPQAGVLSGEQLMFARYMFNYTMTFQHEADIFYPYGHSEKLTQPLQKPLPDFSKGRTNMVLWMVSNCHSRKRMLYAEELAKHAQVNIAGGCNKTHGDPCHRNYKCIMKMKGSYKFYLSFENCLCHEYITEKFWKALVDGIVPIVMGASKRTYERVAPPHSFIHVDDFVSPQQLAEYLHVLDKNDTLYNAYYAWRNTHAIRWEYGNCEICRFATEKPPVISDITKRWNAYTQCFWP